MGIGSGRVAASGPGKSEAAKILMAPLESVEFLRAGDGGGSIRVGNAGLVRRLFPLGEGGLGVVPQATAGALDGSLGTRTVTPSSASLAATEFQVVAHSYATLASSRQARCMAGLARLIVRGL